MRPMLASGRIPSAGPVAAPDGDLVLVDGLDLGATRARVGCDERNVMRGR